MGPPRSGVFQALLVLFRNYLLQQCEALVGKPGDPCPGMHSLDAGSLSLWRVHISTCRWLGCRVMSGRTYRAVMIQGLYQCQPFRQQLLEFAARGGGGGGRLRDETVPNTLGSLFAEIAGQKKKTGVIAPKRFIQKVKHDWEQYRSYDEHQARTPPYNYPPRGVGPF